MAWIQNATLFCLLIIGLSPLGHCADSRAEGRPKPLKNVNRFSQGRLLFGQNRNEPQSKSEVRPGKLIIGLNDSGFKDYSNIPENLKSGNVPFHEHEYQADQAVIGLSELQPLQGSVYSFGVSNSPAVHQLLGMRPEVDCEDNAMKLRVHGGIGSFVYGLRIDRGSVPPLPLLRVSSECGLQTQKTRWGLILIIPYDGCYVAQEMDAYILPLQLWGLPAKMYCPMMNLAPSPPSVTCNPNGMIVKTQLDAPVEELRVKVGTEWKPLLNVSSECGYSIVSFSEGVTISAPYEPCMDAKGGMYTFHMAAKKEFKVFCPSPGPSTPPDMSSPVSSDETGGINTIASSIDPMSTHRSSVPAQRPTIWPLFGRPYPSPALKAPPVPDKSAWTDLRSVPTSTTQVPTPPTSSVKPQNFRQIPSIKFPITREFLNPPKPQPTPVPITKDPAPTASPEKPKPAPVGHSFTSRTKPSVQSSEVFGSSSTIPGKPILQAPDSVVSSPSVFLGEKSFSPSVQLRPESVFRPERQRFPPTYQQKPAVLPTAAPSKPLGASSEVGATGFRYPKVPERLSGTVFAPGGRPPHYPKRPAIFPTAAPSKPLGAFGEVGATGFRYPKVPEMLSGSVFAPGVRPPQYPKRPAIYHTAAPSRHLEAFGGFRKAGLSFQAAPQMSKQLGYLECCPSTALYSSCCPPMASYHQHTHHHFGSHYHIFNRGAATGSARNSASYPTGVHDGSETQPAKMQTVNYESHPVYFPLNEEIQQGASKSLASSSTPHQYRRMKPSALNSLIPPNKHSWPGRVPQLPAMPPAHDYKPVAEFPPKLHQSSLAYSKLTQNNPNVGPVYQEKHHPSLPIPSQTNPGPFMFVPHERTTPLNYGHSADFFSTHFYDKPPTYSEAKFPPAVEEPHSFSSMSELPRQHPKFIELYTGLSKPVFGSEPAVHLKANSQAQVPGTHGRFASSFSDYVTRFHTLSGPFNKHWVPVINPKQGAHT